MKKVYSKPVIIFESFRLTSNIAYTCDEHKANSGDVNSCDYTYNGLTLFVGDKDCLPGIYDENGVCYHVSLDANVVFGS